MEKGIFPDTNPLEREAALPRLFDFHTHRLSTPAGSGIVCLSREVLLASPGGFRPAAGALYSAGIHPWWTAEDVAPLLSALERLLPHPQVVMLGECGFDRLRGGTFAVQQAVFDRQVALSESLALPLVVHCVRAFDLLLSARKRLRPSQCWTVHGFRGGPLLARQLLDAGFHLSFGARFNPDSLRLTPPGCRRMETDDGPETIEEVGRRQAACLG